MGVESAVKWKTNWWVSFLWEIFFVPGKEAQGEGLFVSATTLYTLYNKAVTQKPQMCVFYIWKLYLTSGRHGFIIFRIDIFSAGIYLFKFNNENTRAICEICSELTIKTPKRHRLGIFNSWKAFIISFQSKQVVKSLFQSCPHTCHCIW